MSDQAQAVPEYVNLCAQAGEFQFTIEVLKAQLQQANQKINDYRVAANAEKTAQTPAEVQPALA